MGGVVLGTKPKKPNHSQSQVPLALAGVWYRQIGPWTFGGTLTQSAREKPGFAFALVVGCPLILLELGSTGTCSFRIISLVVQLRKVAKQVST